MTAARHARPQATTPRALLAAVAALAALLALAATVGAPANTAPARPWHYPYRMDRNRGFEWFTPGPAFWKGLCLQ